MARRRIPFAAFVVPSLFCGVVGGLGMAAEPRVDFAREIQPLLASRCYDCHGPEKAKGGLRLTALNLAIEPLAPR